jgi:hypothetical protein
MTRGKHGHLGEVLRMKLKRRSFVTGNRNWTSSRTSPDGRNVTIELPSERGVVKMTVRKKPLELVPTTSRKER